MSTSQQRYSIDDKVYIYDPVQLRYKYNVILLMNDAQFVENAHDILHYSAHLAWIKNIPTKELLKDTGLIHELIHLCSPGSKDTVNVKKVKSLFEEMFVTIPKNVNFNKIC